jgi:hypothetical protein
MDSSSNRKLRTRIAATTLTLIIGVASLYGALFVLGPASAALALDQTSFRRRSATTPPATPT